MSPHKTTTASLRRERRHRRVRKLVSGSASRPRLSVFKSNRYLSAQLIDDVSGTTLAAASTKSLTKGSMREKAVALGKEIAQKAHTKNVTRVVFDRGGYLYAGRIKAVADGAREGGLVF